jgi:XTP/dITP diphosphohydrolase
MEKRIIFATGNQDKMKEIHMILQDLGLPVYSMKEVGINVDIVEDGSSFEENALIKANAIAKLLPDDIILADDSGLEIDYLDKAPGIYSARFMGEDTPYPIKNQALLDQLEGVPDVKRTARFVCAISAVLPGGETETVRGTMEGIIGHEIVGGNGFGYDPIFYLPEFSSSAAQLDPEKKNEISHRGKALRTMREIMKRKYLK